MRTARILGSAIALGLTVSSAQAPAKAPEKAPAKTAAGKAESAKVELMAVLDPKLAGAWVTNKVMDRGYLANLLHEKAALKHPNFSDAAATTLAALDKNFTSHGACGPNLRAAFARLVGGAARGAGHPLSPTLKPVLAAFATASASKAQDGGLAPVIKALNEARKAMKSADYRKAIYGSIVWLRKPCTLFSAASKDKGAAVKPAKPTKPEPPKLADIAGGPYESFKKQLTGESLQAIMAYHESLKGPAQKAFQTLARGLLRVTSGLQANLSKVGKSGLGIEDLWLKTVREVLVALGTRKYDVGEGATRWAFATLDAVAERLRAVFRTAGVQGVGFVKVLQERFRVLKFRVRDISSGKAKWEPGKGAKEAGAFNAQVIAGWKKVLAGLKPAMEKAKAAWKKHLEGYSVFLGGTEKDPLGEYKTVFSEQEKSITAWINKHKVGSKERDALVALVQSLGYVLSEGRIIGAQVAGDDTMGVMTVLLTVIPEAVGGAATKGLQLGKGLGKFLIDTLQKWPAIWEKILAATKTSGPEFAAYIKTTLAKVVTDAVARAKEVLAGKTKLEPGKATFWFRKDLDALRAGFPKKFDSATFMKTAVQPKEVSDFFSGLSK